MTSGKETDVRTRFAPSPTGHLHIGGARTAIFNWLYTRHMGGKFILRIEDTDRERSKDEYTEAILDGMKWLGLDYDSGPFYQSERENLYQGAIERLITGGNAYRCYCTPEDLKEKRSSQMERGEKPKYDGTCRGKDLPSRSEVYVVRFKTPQTGTTAFRDMIKGNISFDNGELDDLIIRRSDGSPTYNLTVVVDDADMKITHVIRGDDHINNTPRQMLIFKALGYDIPTFAHVPLIFGSDQKKLSKRHGALSVVEYRELGYLPEALVNYLVRLGWSSGDQEIFSREELIDKFDISDVGKSAGIFNPEKLEWLNAHYIKEADPERLARDLLPFIERQGYGGYSHTADCDKEYLIDVVKTLQERSKTLTEMAKMGGFYFKDEIEYDEKAAKKFLKTDVAPAFQSLIAKFRSIDPWNQDTIGSAFQDVLDEMEIKLGKVAQPLRVALTGGTVSPGIFDIICVLGRDRVIERIDKAIAFIES